MRGTAGSESVRKDDGCRLASAVRSDTHRERCCPGPALRRHRVASTLCRSPADEGTRLQAHPSCRYPGWPAACWHVTPDARGLVLQSLHLECARDNPAAVHLPPERSRDDSCG